MERPIVVTDPSDRAPELIREAGELAEAAGVKLRVLTIVSEEEFADEAEILQTIGEVEDMGYNMSPGRYAETIAEKAVSDLLSSLDLETETFGVAVSDDGDRANAILDVAESEDCDYIFLVGRRRSPTGKVIFGDTAQSVILNFDQYVVTTVD